MIPEDRINEYSVNHAGGYCHLRKNGENLFTDCPSLLAGMDSFIHKATGNVLIGGLGLGWLVEHLITKKDVKTVTCIEIAQEIIDLVLPHIYINNKLKVVCGDIRTCSKKGYDWCYSDAEICKNDVEELQKDCEKYIANVVVWSG